MTAIGGLLQEPLSTDGFLEKGGMELLLTIFVKKGEQFDIVRKREAQLVADAFFDERGWVRSLLYGLKCRLVRRRYARARREDARGWYAGSVILVSSLRRMNAKARMGGGIRHRR